MSVNKDITTIYKPELPHVLSLGAGVQSSTLALMAANGMVEGYPHLTAAVFADTQDEPASVYKWLDWLEQEIARSPFPFPVHRITAGRLQDRSLRVKNNKANINIPVFTKGNDGKPEGRIPGRHCTFDFKIVPVRKFCRREFGVVRGQKHSTVSMWIGISLDEVHRMKDSLIPWATNMHPLIDMRMNRHDCKRWMEKQGYPEPPRSACVYCPFHSNQEWRRLKREEPWEFQKAVVFESKMQEIQKASSNMKDTPYLHRSCVPLGDVDLDTDIDKGQTVFDLWGGECEGMCGV